MQDRWSVVHKSIVVATPTKQEGGVNYTVYSRKSEIWKFLEILKKHVGRDIDCEFSLPHLIMIML